jgi:hypothetical protein
MKSKIYSYKLNKKHGTFITQTKNSQISPDRGIENMIFRTENCPKLQEFLYNLQLTRWALSPN